MAAKNITAFSFSNPAATGVINGTDISVTVPIGTDVTALAATFIHTGASVAVGAVAQTSGVTANDFTAAVTYTVTAADATTQDFVVTVTISQVLPAQIAQVRRTANETTTAIYADADIQAFIEDHALVDADGFSPDQDNWTATYDLNAAAADIWEEKAGRRADNFDFSADGGNYSRSQSYEQAMKQARYFRARRSMKTVTMEPTPKEDVAEEEE